MIRATFTLTFPGDFTGAPTHADAEQIVETSGLVHADGGGAAWETARAADGLVEVSFRWPPPPKDRVGINRAYYDVWARDALAEAIHVSAANPDGYRPAARIAVRIWRRHPKATVVVDDPLLAWIESI